MPASYSIDPDRRLVLTRGWGEVTDGDLLEYYRELAADPAFDPTYYQLGDLSEVTKLSITSAAVRAAAALAVFHPSARRAFVAPADQTFGMARMFGTMSEMDGQNVRVFRSSEEARQWLAER